MPDAPKPIEIFAAGTHTSNGGATLTFSEDDLAATASAYDPALHEAPIVVGHPRHDGPAYGWVKSLSASNGRLTAVPHQVNPEFAELVRMGAFKKVSAAFYPPTAPANPKPGAYYLRHVGFLGAQPPSLKGLKPVEFTDGADGLVTVEVAFAEADGQSLAYRVAGALRTVARLFGRQRDRLIETDGIEAADQVLEPWDVDRLGTLAGEIEGLADATPTDAAPTTYSEPQPKETPAVADEPNKAPAIDAVALEQRERDLAAREAAFAEREAHATAATVIDQLVAEGKVLPRDRDRCVAFMASLDADAAVEFSEGGKTIKTSQRDAFQEFLNGLPRLVEFGEIAPAAAAPSTGRDTVAFAAPDGMTVDAERLAIHQKAVAYQHDHPDVDYITAVRAVGGK